MAYAIVERTPDLLRRLHADGYHDLGLKNYTRHA